MKKLFALLLVIVLALYTFPAYAESEYEELRQGSKGDAVTALQERLKELGYYTIGIDGDYGAGTVNAVKAFQERNDLEQNGVASVELQQLLFSDEARKAPYQPAVFPTSLSLSGGYCRYRIRNNTDERIDSVRTIGVAYGNNGEMISDKAISYEHNLLTKDWGITETISTRQSGLLMHVNEDYVGWETAMAKTFAIGVISYHTESGYTVTFAPKDVTFYLTDGTVQGPEEEPEPYIYSDSEAAEIAELRTGITTKNLYPRTAEYYGTVEGLYVMDVAGGSLGERAGFLPGDIITTIDGESSLLVSAQHRAAKAILGGETAEYEYMRNGKSYSVSISMDMETTSESEESDGTLSIADELLKYGDLLERGLIAQEEYDILKEKLIYG